MAKQGRRNFNDSAWSTSGRTRAIRDLGRRAQRIERAPVHIDIPTVKAPRKAGRVVGATNAGSRVYFLEYRNETDRLIGRFSNPTSISYSTDGSQIGFSCIKSYKRKLFFIGTLTSSFATFEDAVLCRATVPGDPVAEMTNPSGFVIQHFDIGDNGRIWGLFNDDVSLVRVYYSDDEGETWTLSLTLAGEFGYNSRIKIATSPYDADRVAVIEHFDVPNSRLRATTDGGSTWTDLDLGELAVDTTTAHCRWLSTGRLVISYVFSAPVTLGLKTFYSDDGGLSVTGGVTHQADGLLYHDGLYVDEDDNLFLFFRDDTLPANNVYSKRSKDRAETWESLPNELDTLDQSERVVGAAAKGTYLYVITDYSRIWEVKDRATGFEWSLGATLSALSMSADDGNDAMVVGP